MKLTFLAVAVLAQDDNVSKFPQRRLYEIRKQVDWIVDNHLNCRAIGMQTSTIKKRMNGLLDRIQAKYIQCWEDTPGLAPAAWSPSDEEWTKEGDRRKKRAADDADRFITSSPEAAVQQLGKGILKKWMKSHEKKFPCIFEKPDQVEHFATNFDRWVNQKMMTRLMKCNAENAISQ